MTVNANAQREHVVNITDEFCFVPTQKSEFKPSVLNMKLNRFVYVNLATFINSCCDFRTTKFCDVQYKVK